MTDKEYREQKQRIRKLKDKWFKNLGLGWWRINISYIRDEKFTGKAEYAPKVFNGIYEAAFVVSTDYYYNSASIDCYLSILKDLPDDELEEYFLHELMHIILNPMHTKATSNQEELVATKLAQAFLWSTGG